MRTWTMRDMPGLVENLDGVVYALQLAVEEGRVAGVRAAVKALRTVVGVMEECVEGERGKRRDEQ